MEEFELPIQPGILKTNELITLPNLLLIAGTGRKVGKTTLACRLISQCSEVRKTAAIKISPHLHKQEPGQQVMVENADFAIIRETNPHSGKDSSRMLSAGSDMAFYIQTNDKNLKKPLSILLDYIPGGYPIICESGALLHFARPGLFLLVKRKNEMSVKKGAGDLGYPPDSWLTFDGDGFEPKPEHFWFDGANWQIVS